MKGIITADSFGAELPRNWERIADLLNEIIECKGIADDQSAINELWDKYWAGEIRWTREGWHDIAGYHVYVEGNKVVRGLSDDRQLAVYPYRDNPHGGYDLDQNMSPDAFRAAVKRGTVTMQ